MPEMNIIQALNHTLKEELKRDKNLVIFGEDAGSFGGVFRVTLGLQEEFGEERVFNTPLSEQGIVGFAIGMAQKGMKPIAEIQFADYIFPAYDQIVNEMAKMRYRTGNQYSSPVLIRTPYGGGIHGGHYHSQSPEAQFLHTPGLIVVVVSSPFDAKGLLIAAIDAQDPVIFFEPKRIYRALKGEVPEERYSIPLGKGDLARIGKDLTLVGWGAQHHQNMAAAEDLFKKENIDIEVINLRTLNPCDEDLVLLSLQKTGRLVIAHEAPLTGGFGAELAAISQEKGFLYLKAPVRRCCGWDTPFPHTLEHAYLPDKDRVKKTVLETINY